MQTPSIDQIKQKIAKLLRLATSTNANEAANAADMVHKLCAEHGLTQDAIDPDCDNPDNKAINWETLYQGNRRNFAEINLLTAVVEHFNGDLLLSWSTEKQANCCEIFASQGRKIEIELYFEYLLETMKKASKRAKLESDPYKLDRGYERNFQKAYAQSVWSRIRRMKREKQELARRTQHEPALVAVSRGNKEQANNTALMHKLNPRISKGTSQARAHGSGAMSGRDAGSSVSLSRQMNNSSMRALPGS